MKRNTCIRFLLIILGVTSILFILSFLLTVTQQRTVYDKYSRIQINRWLLMNETSDLNETSLATARNTSKEPRGLEYYISNTYGSCHIGKIVKLSRKPERFIYFTKNYTLEKEPAKSALSETVAKHFCVGNIVSYNKRVFVLHDVYMFPRERSDNGVIGGEKVINVLNQKENKEFYQFRNGFLQLACTQQNVRPSPIESRNKWIASVKYVDLNAGADQMETVDIFIIAIERGDYANLHNWARGIFNVFLVMIKFNIQPDEMTVLFLDGHPFSALDLAWEEIFGPIQRVGHLQHPVLYKNLIFTFPETDGPVSDYHYKSIGDTEEYRAFVLSRHGLNSEASELSCPRLKITIIIRRNAVYHPRNIEGRVGRKIFNEAELIGKIIETFPDACVQAIMMETLPFNLQLEIISQTDVLIGMHGAGMTHTLFLPQHAAVLELFPKGFKTGRPWFECYQSIARWRNLTYDTWENFDSKIEMPHDYTILPVDVILPKLRGLVNKLCKY